MTMPTGLRRLLGRTVRRTVYTLTSRRPVREVRILAYHSVDDTGSTLSVTAEELREHLDFLSRNGWRALSMTEYLERVEIEQSSDGREVLLTFDDGYQNFCDVVAPLLAGFGFTATVFVPTDFIGTKPEWFERDRDRIAPFLREFGFSTTELAAVERMMWSASQQPLMTTSQLRALLAAGFDVQSHSAGHHFLPSLPDDALVADLGRSAAAMAQLLGVRPLALCYPYGASDDRVHAAARQAGFAAGFRATPERRARDRFAIGRIGVAGGSGSFFDFRFYLSSAFDAYVALRQSATQHHNS